MPHVYTEGDRVSTVTQVGHLERGSTGTITRVHFGTQFLFDYDVQFDSGLELSVHEDEVQFNRTKLPAKWRARIWWALVRPLLVARGWDL